MMCDAHGRANAAHQQEVGMCAARPPRLSSGGFSLPTLSFGRSKESVRVSDPTPENSTTSKFSFNR